MSYPERVVTDCAIWTGVAIAPIFVIYYTWLARWWRNATGRSVVALDVAAWLVLLPVAITLADPSAKNDPILMWIKVGALLCVPLVILYRLVAFERVRRHRLAWAEFERDASRQALRGTDGPHAET